MRCRILVVKDAYRLSCEAFPCHGGSVPTGREFCCRFVGEAAPGEDDHEHGRHSDAAAGHQEHRPVGPAGDECAAKRPSRCVKARVEQPHQQHAVLGVVVQPHDDDPSEQLRYRQNAQQSQGEGELCDARTPELTARSASRVRAVSGGLDCHMSDDAHIEFCSNSDCVGFVAGRS